MDRSEIVAMLAEALETPESDLEESTLLTEIPTYDSAGILAVIASVDRGLSKQLDPDKLVACNSIGDVVTLILES